MQTVQDGKFRKKTSFAMVSNVALRDTSLSLKAKGLYAFIQSYITLENFTLYKTFIFKSHENDGVKGINNAWKELKEHGYLKQFRIRVVEDGKSAFKYEYELLDEPDLTTPATLNVKLDGSVSETDETDANNDIKKDAQEESSTATTDCENTADMANYSEVKAKVTQRVLGISEDEEKEEMETPAAFRTIGVDEFAIRDLIVEVLLSKDKTIKIGKDLKNGDEVRAMFTKFNTEHLYYLETNLMDSKPEVTNPKQYLLTAIYNTVKTYGVSRTGLIELKE